ncbi:MAG: carbohydrate ABC transporter permease [Rhizobiales bacterium]|nr:carbohydrate ABC transporter permease [Hyphomicrobiales bacterium]
MNRHRIGATLAVTGVIALVGLAIFPFYWMVVTAMTSDAALFGEKAQLLPDPGHIGIFAEAFRISAVPDWLRNSAVVATGTAIVTLLLALPMGYAMSRFSFRGKLLVGVALLVTQMLPEAVLVVPLFSIFRPLGLLNSHVGLVLANAAFTLPVAAWLLKNAIDLVPADVEEAAVIDGCSTLGILGRIILPIIAPSVAAAAVIAFFHGWNEYVFALTFITDDSLKLASVGLAGFVGEISTPIQSVMAVGAIYTLPAVALYLVMQRFIVSGLASGSVKG